jgi:hypothetical protein
MIIEAGVVAGYLAAWATGKARRAASRIDAEADAVIDGSLDRLHEVVEARLGGHPVLAELANEARQAGQVSTWTLARAEQTLAEAANDDEAFAQAVTGLVARLREAKRIIAPVSVGSGSTVLTGEVHARARDGGFAFGQVTGGVQIGREAGGPPLPGRPGH